MRRALPLLALALAASLAAAGSGDGAKPARKLVVGLAADVGGLRDGAANELAYAGLVQARQRLGIEVRVAAARSPADYRRDLDRLGRAKVDLVVAVGYRQGPALAAAARAFPAVRFVGIDTPLAAPPRNALGIVFREQEAAYLAGYLAALEAQRAGEPTISAVGGLELPPVRRALAGYEAGAKAAVPGIEVLSGYAGDAVDRARCRSLALDQIARGSFVVFEAAGACGLGALSAARDRYVWGVGSGADDASLGPHVLTSARARVDLAVYDAVLALRQRRFRGGRTLTLGLASGRVGLGAASELVPPAELARVRALAARIRAGAVRLRID